METNVTMKEAIPAGSVTQRKKAMEAMIKAGEEMIRAYNGHGYYSLPKEYSVIAVQVQMFIEWRKGLEFNYELEKHNSVLS